MAIASAPVPALAQSDARPTTRDILIDRIEVGRQSVGMIAMTVKDGGRELVAYGKSGTADDRPLGADTVFEAGSITKVFTALLLADMVLRREVALADPVATLLPSGSRLPERGKPITLLDLATYTSGLPNLPRNFKSADEPKPYADYTAARMLDFLASYELEHEPGTHYEYANLGFALLGHALSVRAGKPYEALVVERICAPLGLGDTRITLSPSMKARSVQGHDSNLFPVPDWEYLVFAGAGALHSTANDLATFVEAAMGRRPSPLDPAFALLLSTRRPAYKPTPDVALGWFVLTARPEELVFKDGGTAGTRSFIGFSPKTRRGAVLMSNTGWRHNINDIGLHLVDPGYPVKRAGTEFFYRIVDAQLSFELGPDGRAAALVLHQDKKDRRGLRI